VSCSDNPDENYQIYTVNIDGTNLRQITKAPHNNLNCCWLPDGGIAFISDRKSAYAYCYVVTSPVLYRMERDGSKQKRLSANYLMDFTPSVLNDGRIIYTRWEYVYRCACPIHSLWTINPDGTNLAGYFSNRMLAPGTFMDANAIPNSQKIFALATNHNGSCVGAITQIDPRLGPNARESVLNTTPEVNIYARGGIWGNGFLGQGGYEKPFALDEKTYLVTKWGDAQIRTIDGAWAAVLPKNKRSKLGYYSVQPVRKYPVPPVVKSSTLDESVALPEDGSVSGNWAVITMQDVYNGLEPSVKRGEIKRIAVVQELEKPVHSPYEIPVEKTDYKHLPLKRISVGAFGYQFPLVSCGATYAPKKVWGFADVAPDGSATFKAPSEVPIYFMALDAEGRAVQRMRSFTHLMPGEIQSCVGCHVDRNTQSPTRANRIRAMRAKPQELQKPEWGVKGFSYHEVVQPVLDKHCAGCHNPREKNKIDLSGDYTDFFCVSYDNLARKGTLGENNWLQHGVKVDSRQEGESPYTSWIWTINGAEWNTLEVAPKRWGSPASLLAKILRDGHPGKNGKKRIDVPQTDRERIYLWIDLNVPYYPTSASNHKFQIGSRRIYPERLDAVLNDVSRRRCAECHEPNPARELGMNPRNGGDPLYNLSPRGKVFPREFYTRFLTPENNAFLLAPLAKAAGGAQKCSKVVFQTKDDPDYQKILRTFEPARQLIKKRPRADMPDFAESGTLTATATRQ
jgi:mono/diheme cytochrome c family protein